MILVKTNPNAKYPHFTFAIFWVLELFIINILKNIYKTHRFCFHIGLMFIKLNDCCIDSDSCIFVDSTPIQSLYWQWQLHFRRFYTHSKSVLTVTDAISFTLGPHGACSFQVSSFSPSMSIAIPWAWKSQDMTWLWQNY
jgi:hypothetical protein